MEIDSDLDQIPLSSHLPVFDLFASGMKKLLKERHNPSPKYGNLLKKGVPDKTLNLPKHHPGKQMAQKFKRHSARDWPYRMAQCHSLSDFTSKWVQIPRKCSEENGTVPIRILWITGFKSFCQCRQGG